MDLSRREFIKLFGTLMGGWFLSIPKEYTARLPRMNGELSLLEGLFGAEDLESLGNDGERRRFNEFPHRRPRNFRGRKVKKTANISPGERILNEVGYFNEGSTKYFVFDENKYSSSKRKLAPSEWSATNRHLPIKIDPSVINKPGERSPEALKRVVEYTQFHNPRYVAAPGEWVTMCNIAAWDWSRALQVHLPHWIGETEMSANMLFRWISHPQAGGIHGEGWQPVNARAAQLLANRGIPVFALVENTTPRRHGHVCMVYPSLSNDPDVEPIFATVSNGRSRAGNGIKSLRNTFRWRAPTYFVHKIDFILHQVS